MVVFIQIGSLFVALSNICTTIFCYIVPRRSKSEFLCDTRLTHRPNHHPDFTCFTAILRRKEISRSCRHLKKPQPTLKNSVPKLFKLLLQLSPSFAAAVPVLHWWIRCCFEQQISMVDRHNPCNSKGTISLSKVNSYSPQCFLRWPHSFPSLQQFSMTLSMSTSPVGEKFVYQYANLIKLRERILKSFPKDPFWTKLPRKRILFKNPTIIWISMQLKHVKQILKLPYIERIDLYSAKIRIFMAAKIQYNNTIFNLFITNNSSTVP